MFGREIEGNKEIERRFFEFFVVFYIRSFLTEPLMFHLFELYRSENEVSGRDFVSERLADLSNAERNFGSRRTLNVLEVYELALSRFGAEINFILTVLRNPSRRFEHKVEVSYRRPVELSADRAFDFMFVDVGLHFFLSHRVNVHGAFGEVFDKVIRALTGFALLAVHFRVGKTCGVTRSFPNSAVHEDCRVYPVRIFAFLHEFFPPRALDVVLYFHADGTVIPGVAHSAVNIAAGENYSSRLAEIYEFVHRDGSFFFHDNTSLVLCGLCFNVVS